MPWLAQSKPSGPAQACSGQAKARIDGTRSRVYLAPKQDVVLSGQIRLDGGEEIDYEVAMNFCLALPGAGGYQGGPTFGPYYQL